MTRLVQKEIFLVQNSIFTAARGHLTFGENTILHQKIFFLHQTGHDGFSRFRTKKLFLICTKCFFRTFTISHQNYTPEQQKVTNLHQI